LIGSPKIAGSGAGRLSGVIIFHGGGKSGHVDWGRAMLYVAYLTCLAALLSPIIDTTARVFSGAIFLGLTIFFAVDVAARSAAALDAGSEKKPLKHGVQRRIDAA
jgi:hypothetical protein